MSGPAATAAAAVPPSSPDAEESVLGAILLSPGIVDVVADLLRPDHFYRETNGRIYRAMLDLHAAGGGIDAITVADHLERQPDGLLDRIGGRPRVFELAGLAPATSNVAHHARIVRDLATRRALIRAGTQIAGLGFDGPQEARLLVEQAQGLAFALGDHGGTGDLAPVADAVSQTIDRIREAHERGQDVVGLPLGYADLDRLTAGLRPGNLVVVAARPSMGKTGFALGACGHAAVRLGLPTALFTLEMTRGEVVERLVSMESSVQAQHLRTGHLDRDEWTRIYRAADRIQASPLLIDDSAALTLAELRSRARRAKLRHPGLALVVVDYLQLMSEPGASDNRVQEVSKISRGLKVLAGELEVPVLALSQLSRALEQRHDKRPILSDLRESGSIEQDADLVLFVYRDEYYNSETAEEDGTAGIAEVNLAKQRNGPVGMRKLAFQARYARFGDLALPGTVAP